MKHSPLQEQLIQEHAISVTPTPKKYCMSIVIPNYNREDSLPLMFGAMDLMRNEFQDIEILFIDDGSTDASAEIVQEYCERDYFDIKIIRSQNQGAGNARNIGIRQAGSDIILLMDSDIIPTKEMIREHIDFHQRFRDETFVLRGRIKSHKKSASVRRTNAGFQSKHVKQHIIKELDWAEFRSNNISVKKSFLLKSGLFDKDLSAHQDTEIGHRLGKNGLKLFHSDKALGFHYHPVDLHGFFKYALKYGKSRAIWYWKSPGLVDDLVRIGKEDRYGFISYRSPFKKKLKHILKLILVNRLTHRLVVAVGKDLERFNNKHYFYFYRQAYQYYSRVAFKTYLKDIASGRMPITRKPSVMMFAGPMPPEFSGAAIQSLRVSSYLKKQGLTISYISATHRKELAGIGEIQGFTVYRIYMKNKDRVSKTIFALKAAVYLIRQRAHYDMIHMHGGGYLMSGAPAIARLLKKKAVYKMTSFGEDDIHTIRNGRYRHLKYSILKCADRVVAMSSSLRDSYIECSLPDSKLCCIPNTVDVKTFHPVSSDEKRSLREKLGIPQDKFIAVTIASLTKRKRIDYLLRAWEDVVQERPDAYLVIVGGERETEKPFAHRVRKIVRQSKLVRYVMLAGEQENVQEYLQASDLFVFCSKREGFATVQIEAMACGLPSICSSLFGISEDIYVHEKTALVIDSYATFREYAQSILSLIKNDSLRNSMGVEARKTAVDKFSLEQVGNQYNKLFNTLLFEKQCGEKNGNTSFELKNC